MMHWTSWCWDPSVQYKAPPDMDKFNLYSLDLIVQGLLCTVQGPSRHGQFRPVQLGPHHTRTPLYSTRPLQTWISSTCTAWTSPYWDPSVQYKAPPDMDKFNLTAWISGFRTHLYSTRAPPDMDKFSLYSVDFTILGPLCAVQGPSRHGKVQPDRVDLRVQDSSVQYKGPSRHG